MKIKWENRFQCRGKKRYVASANVSVDGTDYQIQEPWPFTKDFNRKFYSHKFKRAGLRYEIAVSISSGDIVWFHGPFPCGSFPDTKIFWLKLEKMLESHERAVADKGYRGVVKCMTDFDAESKEHKAFMSNARARHETVNRRLKEYQSLKQLWRHDVNKHHLVFKCVVTIVQLEFNYGHGPFQFNGFNENILYTT